MLKGTVSQEFRWVFIFINQKLFSRAIVGHHKILILLKGNNQQKKIQGMKGPTILDGLHNSRCGNHDRWAYFFLSEDILIKHYGIVGTAESRIAQLRFQTLLRQPCIHELCYRGSLVIKNYSKSEYPYSRKCFLRPIM